MATRLPDRTRDTRLITGINVTPLVDIVLVLLVVMMVVSTYIVSQFMKVELPTDDGQNEDPLTLTILEDGRIRLNEQEILETQVQEELLVALRNRPGLAVVISANRAVPHGRVVQFVDLARQSGATRFAIKVEEDSLTSLP